MRLFLLNRSGWRPFAARRLPDIEQYTAGYFRLHEDIEDGTWWWRDAYLAATKDGMHAVGCDSAVQKHPCHRTGSHVPDTYPRYPGLIGRPYGIAILVSGQWSQFIM